MILSTPASLFIVAFALATFKVWQFLVIGYWKMPLAFFPATDLLGETHRRHLAWIQRHFLSTWTLPVGSIAMAFALTPWWSWEGLDPNHVLRPIILLASGSITWRAVTMDVDLSTGTWHPGCRGLMLVAWAGVWGHPAFLILLLHTGVTWLRSNYHHQHLALRVLFMFLASLGALPLAETLNAWLGYEGQANPTVPVLFLFLCVSASHYLVPGLQKLRLGPHPASWLIDNRLHHIFISAYLWGWIRFLPQKKVLGFARQIGPFDRLFQAITLGIELGSLFILFDARLCLALLVSFVALQGMIFLLSGILFWHFMVVNVVLAWSIWNLPAPLASSLFGWENGLLAAGILLLFPCRDKVWNPQRLAWWDTCFVGRVHYAVKGKSGSWYGLNNDFMCPDERIFGQSYGAFLTHEKRITKHIGETPMREQFDAIRAAGSDLSKIEEAKQRWGQDRYDPDLESVHDSHIKAFIRNFNAGHRKQVVPGWIKAPGGQWFYWSELPRFDGQEPVDELVVDYREQYFDGEHIRLVTEQRLKHFTFRSDLGASAADASEIAPKT